MEGAGVGFVDADMLETELRGAGTGGVVWVYAEGVEVAGELLEEWVLV